MADRFRDVLPQQHPQVQYSLSDQLRDLIPFAQRLGLYDAAEYLTRVSEPTPESRVYWNMSYDEACEQRDREIDGEVRDGVD